MAYIHAWAEGMEEVGYPNGGMGHNITTWASLLSSESQKGESKLDPVIDWGEPVDDPNNKSDWLKHKYIWTN